MPENGYHVDIEDDAQQYGLPGRLSCPTNSEDERNSADIVSITEGNVEYHMASTDSQGNSTEELPSIRIGSDGVPGEISLEDMYAFIFNA